MDVTLTIEPGRELGTRPSRRLRAEGKVPAVVYGLGREPQSVLVDWPSLRKAITTEAGLNALITLENDGESHLSIIKDLQRHPLRRDVLHVDFQLIDRDESLSVDVPIVLHGIAKAVEAKKGMVDQLKHTLTINAKPGFIPTQLDADVSELEIGGTNLQVRDIALPDGVTTDVEPDEIVAQGSATRSTIILETGIDPDAEPGEEGAEGEGGEGEGEGGSAEGEGGDG
jgi:large subunit ribosomal protein L25